MQSKTVTELRVLAKARGIKGYSTMRKDELIRVLARPPRAARPKPQPARPTRPKDTQARRSVRKSTVSPRIIRAVNDRRTAAQAPEPRPQQQTRDVAISDDEQRIEGAKFISAPPGLGASTRDFDGDLGEAIESLPLLARASVRLLPQKPGIVHGYWVLAPGHLLRQPGTKLRLSHVSEGATCALAEIAVSAEHGHHYFHVDPGLPAGELRLQLGHYRENGDFVIVLQHRLVRLPRGSASSATDANWWVSEEQFRRMYLRAGGELGAGKLMWSAGTSSLSSR